MKFRDLMKEIKSLWGHIDLAAACAKAAAVCGAVAGLAAVGTALSSLAGHLPGRAGEITALVASGIATGCGVATALGPKFSQASGLVHAIQEGSTPLIPGTIAAVRLFVSDKRAQVLARQAARLAPFVAEAVDELHRTKELQAALAQAKENSTAQAKGNTAPAVDEKAGIPADPPTPTPPTPEGQAETASIFPVVEKDGSVSS